MATLTLAISNLGSHGNLGNLGSHGNLGCQGDLNIESILIKL